MAELGLTRQEVLATTDFRAWVERSQAGETLEYYRGNFVTDAAFSSAAQAKRMAAIRHAEEAGDVHLVQRRHGDFDYSYLAVRRPRRR